MINNLWYSLKSNYNNNELNDCVIMPSRSLSTLGIKKQLKGQIKYVEITPVWTEQCRLLNNIAGWLQL